MDKARQIRSLLDKGEDNTYIIIQSLNYGII